MGHIAYSLKQLFVSRMSNLVQHERKNNRSREIEQKVEHAQRKCIFQRASEIYTGKEFPEVVQTNPTAMK